MTPAEICRSIIGQEKLRQVLDMLSSPQTKSVIKEGGLKVKLPNGFVSQKKRRQLWAERILAAINDDGNDTASELLQQWLLHHRREILVSYLDMLGVKHRDGETDDSFLISGSQDKIRNAASDLLTRFDPDETRAYLLYIAYQQRSPVFDHWAPLATAPSGPTPTSTADAPDSD